MTIFEQDTSVTRRKESVLMILCHNSYIRVVGRIEVVTVMDFQTFTLNDGVGGYLIERGVLSIIVLAIGAVLLCVEAENQIPASMFGCVRLALVQNVRME